MSLTVAKKPIVKFAPKGTPSFYDTAKARVNDYFTENNITQYYNSKMVVKTIVMLSLYFVPYVFIVTGLTTSSIWIFYGMYFLMGMGIVGIGTSVMHDSNHGSYTPNKTTNRTLASVLNVLGGYSLNWRIQHNVLHHTYTNIVGLDEDIDAGDFLRMSPVKPLKPYHKYQWLYAWPLYCIMNIYWIIAKDYRLLVRYHQNDLLQKEKTTLRKSVIELSMLKVLYIAYMIVLPIIFSGYAWYQIVLGMVIMHVIAGFSLACIFQPAHVVETSEFPAPDDDRKMENNWAVHQLLNTANFAPDNKIVSWYIGGLNYQIEHHLFPHICHVHYPALSKIVRKTAEEYNIPYLVMPTVRNALLQHGKMLKRLGRE